VTRSTIGVSLRFAVRRHDIEGRSCEDVEVVAVALVRAIVATSALAVFATPTSPASSSSSVAPGAADAGPTITAFPVPAGSGPHDVSPAADGGVWFTAQHSGHLGLLDPTTGESHLIDLGEGSRPHGVITAADGAAWVTDGGRNSIIRVDPASQAISEYPLPDSAADANLNPAVFDGDGVLWFTGQAGWYGRVDTDGAVTVYPAPEGRGPYGITVTPGGDVYYASLAGSYVGRIATDTGEATVLEPPIPDQGSRRVWSDSSGRVWVSGWNSGDVFVYDPAGDEWRSWHLPGENPQPYAIYVDDQDVVWLSDFGADAIVRFDPVTETFTTIPLPSRNGEVRQLLGRPGEVWGAESSADQLIVVRDPTTGPSASTG
jgi:virginiamycin B lyase